MKKIKMIYEGKAKKLFTTEEKDVLIQEFKDDATAFNAQKKGTIIGKGVVNNKISAIIFKYLQKHDIPTHFIKQLDERDMLISRKASELTLIIVMGYIFLTCIILYTIYEKTNSVPAGWMWFIGYTCIFIGYIANSAISLILYRSKSSVL